MSDNEVIFWALAVSANSAVIRSFMNVCGIAYKEENGWGVTRTPEFIAKFPNNACPAIEHGDAHVTESLTILRYLARTFDSAKQYYVVDDPAVASKIDMVADYTNTSFCRQLPSATYPTMGFPSYPGEVGHLEETKEHTTAAAKASGDMILAMLNDKYAAIFLKDTKFLYSDTPTIADFRFAPLLTQVQVCCKLPERIEKYLSDMMELPGFADGFKPADEFSKTHHCS
jgi:glutathione S-transferase